MTIKELEEEIIPEIEKLDGVSSASVNDYNSETAEIFISIEKGSDKDISDIIAELNEKIEAMYISEEATIPSSLCVDDVDAEEPGGISPNRGV